MKRYFKIILSLITLSFVILCLGVSTNTAEAFYVDSYYTDINTISGEYLLDSLHSIISKNTKDVGYSGLWNAYKTTDVYPGTTTVWDMYSNEEYNVSTDHSGNYSKEGDMFNREHSIPQSWFGEKSPMKSDLFHVYPTDGYVNGKRNNFPYGEVKTASYTSKNGSKLGSSALSSYTGTVFEPIDEYKGDFARTYFYMATRYSDVIATWGNGAEVVFTKTYPYLTDYAIELFTKWNELDPVSEKETTRNQAVYAIQNNRNPFIDHPEYIDIIWGDETDISGNTTNLNLSVDATKDNSSGKILSASVSVNAILNIPNMDKAKYYVVYTKSSNIDKLLVEYYSDETVMAFASKVKGSYKMGENKEDRVKINIGNLDENYTIVFIIELDDELYFTSQTTNSTLGMINYYLENDLITTSDEIAALEYLKENL